VLLLVPLALAACGRKGPPVAPERRLPAAVADLSATVASEGVQLTWTLPRLRVDRSPVKDLRRVEVYRRPETGAAAAPPRPAILTFGGLFGPQTELPGFDRVANIVLAEPPKAPVEIAGSQVRYTDAQGLTFGQRYTYVVVAIDAQGRPSPPSNRVAVAMTAPPKAPVALTATAGDREVRLTWTAPDALEDGSQATEELLYNVFRATTREAPPGRPINPEPIATPSYVDIGLQNDATYYYSVRAQVGPTGPASRPTKVVAATPENLTPPAQPRGLVAVVAGTTVRLAWEAVSSPDLAGYRIYRSTMAGRGHQLLTAELLTTTTFVDTTARPGHTYYYVVTAVDRTRRANESVPSPEASATVP
jgi:fibronectin type 3 domain-containing protein